MTAMNGSSASSEGIGTEPVSIEKANPMWLNKLARDKTALLEQLFAMEPVHVPVVDPKTKQPRPRRQGEDIVYLWDELYANDPVMKSIIVETVTGPSTPNRDYYDAFHESNDAHAANPVMPYQQLRALVGDGGKWKWPEIWKQLDLLPRRGPAWRHPDDPSNLNGRIVNPNPDIKVPLNCLIVGGGPVGLRLAIELVLGGHRATIWEKRREIVDPETGKFQTLGFTNRINRPHINNFCRNDLDRLNGRNFMTSKMCYPVFTNTHTSSIGIDELQMLLLKTALLVGVQFRLGVGYKDAVVDVEERFQNSCQRPSWVVSYTADDIARERYSIEESGQERFDALFGCDGGNSKVRKTQEEWLGSPHTRVYKKMFGIVSNLRKCNRQRLKELGFSNGLEPEDRAGLQTGVYFYKASYHNYLIVHPSKEEMAAEGIPWKAIYTFDKAREVKGKDSSSSSATQVDVKEEQAHLKAKLKKYMTKKAKSLGIPIDTEAENDGFVEAPNDVMGFDFSQFYNCEKSAAVYVPPLDWDAKKNGDWEIQCPLVALAGDAVTDPNWLLGVGLQRGWNSAMDACFYADNLYNNSSFNGKPPLTKDPIVSPIEWSQHLDNIMTLMQTLGNEAREGRLSTEMDMGLYDERGPVVMQIKRKLMARNTEPLIPQYVPNVEPWGRYKTFELEVKKNFKGKDLYENEHAVANRELAIFQHNERFLEKASMIRNSITRPKSSMLTWSKRFECSAFWGMMSLLEIDGKLAPNAEMKRRGGPSDRANNAEQLPTGDSGILQISKPNLPQTRGDTSTTLCNVSSASPLKLPPNPREVKEIAEQKSNRLHEAIVTVAMNGPTSHHHSKTAENLGKIIFKKGVYGTKTKEMDLKSLDEVYESNEEEPLLRRETSENARLESTSLSTQRRSDGEINPCGRIFTDLKIKCLGYEKELLRAKLNHAQAEVEKISSEQRALEARMSQAKQEVLSIQNCLRAYEAAENQLKQL